MKRKNGTFLNVKIAGTSKVHGVLESHLCPLPMVFYLDKVRPTMPERHDHCPRRSCPRGTGALPSHQLTCGQTPSPPGRCDHRASEIPLSKMPLCVGLRGSVPAPCRQRWEVKVMPPLFPPSRDLQVELYQRQGSLDPSGHSRSL